MSHFSVLVIGGDVDKQLQPYHEYECTGIEDEYVVDVDITDEVIEQFNESRRVLVLANGEVFSPYDDCFYRRPTVAETATIGPIAGSGSNGKMSWHSKDWNDGRGYSTRVRFVPEGAQEGEMAADEARKHGVGYATLAECATEYFGSAFERDGRFYRKTNPNKRWDYWRIGGRWTGTLLLKAGAHGLVGKKAWDNEGCPPGYADQAMKGDIDFTQMRNDAEVKARALWKETRRLTGGQAWESWDDTRLRYPNINDARAKYAAQPAIEMLKASGRREYSWDIDDDLALDEDIYIARRRAAACSFFAFVRDSQCTERGRMGWFGCASDEISEVQWHSMFNDMLDALPDDTLLTVVDCHI